MGARHGKGAILGFEEHEFRQRVVLAAFIEMGL